MVTGFSVSVDVGIFFGVWPAVKAARLGPVDALRYEERTSVQVARRAIDACHPHFTSAPSCPHHDLLRRVSCPRPDSPAILRCRAAESQAVPTGIPHSASSSGEEFPSPVASYHVAHSPAILS